MKLIQKKYTIKSALRTLLYTAVINTIIALILSAHDFKNYFSINLVYCQCIGLSICTCMMVVLHTGKTPRWQLVRMAGAILVGAVVGLLIGSYLSGRSLSFDPRQEHNWIAALTMAVGFGTAVSYFFVSKYRIADSEDTIQQERIRRLHMEKEIAETRLKLLQAQIEPHFLFNTLSNVLSLMESEKEQAAEMLTDLTRFLRATLERTREQESNLGQELEVVRAYLNVLKIRMGDRLTYRIDVPEDLLVTTFAPMLLQPLVENAVRHGLEPLVTGGEIQVGAEHRNDRLHVWVTDTGTGIKDFDVGCNGFGLTNIRQRLNTLYGDGARLVLKENPPTGLKAVIEVPIGQD